MTLPTECRLAYDLHRQFGRVCSRAGGSAVCGACIGDPDAPALGFRRQSRDPDAPFVRRELTTPAERITEAWRQDWARQKIGLRKRGDVTRQGAGDRAGPLSDSAPGAERVQRDPGAPERQAEPLPRVGPTTTWRTRP